MLRVNFVSESIVSDADEHWSLATWGREEKYPVWTPDDPKRYVTPHLPFFDDLAVQLGHLASRMPSRGILPLIRTAVPPSTRSPLRPRRDTASGRWLRSTLTALAGSILDSRLPCCFNSSITAHRDRTHFVVLVYLPTHVFYLVFSHFRKRHWWLSLWNDRVQWRIWSISRYLSPSNHISWLFCGPWRLFIVERMAWSDLLLHPKRTSDTCRWWGAIDLSFSRSFLLIHSLLLICAGYSSLTLPTSVLPSVKSPSQLSRRMRAVRVVTISGSHISLVSLTWTTPGIEFCTTLLSFGVLS